MHLPQYKVIMKGSAGDISGTPHMLTCDVRRDARHWKSEISTLSWSSTCCPRPPSCHLLGLPDPAPGFSLLQWSPLHPNFYTAPAFKIPLLLSHPQGSWAQLEKLSAVSSTAALRGCHLPVCTGWPGSWSLLTPAGLGPGSRGGGSG